MRMASHVCRPSRDWHNYFSYKADAQSERSESLLPADSVEKQRAAGAEISVSNWTRVSFLSGFARLLWCGKDLRQFAEVLGGCCE